MGVNRHFLFRVSEMSEYFFFHSESKPRIGYDPGFLLLVEYAILESKGGEPVWVKGMCIDAQNAAMKKNFFPVWASCPLWKPIWSGKDMVCPACRDPLKKTDIVAVSLWD